MRIFSLMVLCCCTIFSAAFSSLRASESLTSEPEATIVMHDGRELVGVLEDEGVAETVNITIRSGSMRVTLHLKREDIKSISFATNPEREQLRVLLDQAHIALSEKDTDQLWHVAVAIEPLDRLEYRSVLRQIVGLDPNHAAAQQALGRQLHEGQWLTQAQINRAKGLIFHNNTWLTPELYQAAKEAEHQETLARIEAREAARERRALLQQRPQQTAIFLSPTWRPTSTHYYRQGYRQGLLNGTLQFRHQSSNSGLNITIPLP